MQALNIVPECYADTKVAEILGQRSGRYNHQHGHGNVAKTMRVALKDKYALGIIDEDTIKVRKAQYFSGFADIKIENNLVLKKHSELQQYLILICPAIEKWLIENAVAVNLLPATFGLPNQLKDFSHISKATNIDKNIAFYRFIKELIKKDAPGIITLQRWIEAFNTNTIQHIT